MAKTICTIIGCDKIPKELMRDFCLFIIFEFFMTVKHKIAEVFAQQIRGYQRTLFVGD